MSALDSTVNLLTAKEFDWTIDVRTDCESERDETYQSLVKYMRRYINSIPGTGSIYIAIERGGIAVVRINLIFLGPADTLREIIELDLRRLTHALAERWPECSLVIQGDRLTEH